MRVIAGSARRAVLDAGPNPGTRPFLELARGALMNALADRLAGARVLDCYAGSGALGIEALSRGAARAVFVEADRGAETALRGNLRRCGLEASARVLTGAAEAILPELAKTGAGGFDLVFVDPPFADAREWPGDPAARIVVRAVERLLAPDGLLSFRLERGKADPPAWGALAPIRDRRYGRSRIVWYQPVEKADGT